MGSLEYRPTEVYSYMGRGRNFGCVAPGCEGYLRKEMEELMTDVIYRKNRQNTPSITA